MRNRWVEALVYTLITLGVVHVLLLIIGILFGNQIGWFGLRMVWAHWENTISGWIAVALGVVLYFVIYSLCTGKESRE